MKKLNKTYNLFHDDILDTVNVFYFLSPVKPQDKFM